MSKPNSSDSRLSKTEGPAAGGGERTNNSGGFERKEEERLGLEWRDYVALAIASLETILLPLVIFIAVIVMILLAIAYFR